MPTLPISPAVAACVFVSAIAFGIAAADVAVPQQARADSTPNSCVGDGQTDDTACLQQLLATEKSVRLAAGHTYLITKPLRIDGAVDFDGNGATLTTPAKMREIVIGGDGATVRGLVLTSSGPDPADGIFLDTNATHVTLRDNRITGNFHFAILFGGSGQHDISIIHNTLLPKPGTRLAWGIAANPSRLARDGGVPPHDIIIRDNSVTDVGADAIELNSPPPVGMSNIDIENNTLSAPFHVANTAGLCIGMAGATNVRISGNRISNCKWQGIHIEHNSSDIVIVGNTINTTIGQPGTVVNGRQHSSGILLLNSDHIKIENNQISNTFNAGIDLAYNQRGANTSVTIAGNTITNAGDYGIHVGGPAGRDLDIIVGATDGFGDNRIIGAKASAYAGCNGSIRGSNVRMWACGAQ